MERDRSLLSQSVPAQHIGATLGISSAIESFCGIVAPPVVGLLVTAGYDDSAGALIAAFANLLGLAVLVYMRYAGLFVASSAVLKKKLN
jgi:MFS-type transporter involved in bile tolerance (Atg22 family)